MNKTFFNHFSDWTQQHDLDPKVLAVMRRVPRHKFVPKEEQNFAYEDHPLPIGHGQTISQPLIVAIMTCALQLKPDHKVLEIGTGSGYQTAILSKLVSKVYTLEIIPELYESAHKRLKTLGYDNIHLKCSDGHKGWQDQAPFDAIMVTAAASELPKALVNQLKNTGKMIIPIGEPMDTQYLMLISKDKKGHVSTKQLLPVRFVPLVD